MSYNYGKKFRREGITVQYRYTNKKQSTKTLVNAANKKPIFVPTKKSHGRKKR